MKLENEFTVPAPVEQAWQVLLDVERVAPCLPGASIEGSEGDEHKGTMTIKIGPITARYAGTVKIEDADEAAHRAVMRAHARDQRGQGTAAATITSTMQEVEGGTRVHVETDMRVTGPAAQFGRGVMQDVSAKLMGRFADCLAEEIAGGAAAPPAVEEAGGAGTPPTSPRRPRRRPATRASSARSTRRPRLRRGRPASLRRRQRRRRRRGRPSAARRRCSTSARRAGRRCSSGSHRWPRSCWV
jgi:carbon monoxide dehydrogenase subunit G